MWNILCFALQTCAKTMFLWCWKLVITFYVAFGWKRGDFMSPAGPPHHSLGGSPYASMLQVTRWIDGIEGGVCVSLLCDICRERQEQGSIWISVPAKWTFTSLAEVQSTSPLLQSSRRRACSSDSSPLRLHEAARLAPPPWMWWSWRWRTFVFSRSLLLSRPTLSFPARPCSSFFTFFDWSCHSLKIRWDINAFLSSVELRWCCGWLPRSIALYRFVRFYYFYLFLCSHLPEESFLVLKKKKSPAGLYFFPTVSTETRVLQRFFLEG